MCFVVGKSPWKLGKIVAENMEEKRMIGEKYHAYNVHSS
jgi:hypothetical protein